MNSPTPPRYQVYVLRYWQEQAAAPERAAVWRFSLEDPNTRQRRGFANLEALLAFLESEIAESGSEDTRCSKPFVSEKEKS